MNRRVFLASGIATIALSRMAKAIGPQTFEAEAAKLIGGATKIVDHEASAGYLVSLTQPGQGVAFSGVRAGSKLSISIILSGAGSSFMSE